MEQNKKNIIKPVNIEGTKKILEQMTNCICKVKNNQIIGTGFFCKIPYNNGAQIYALITSYQIINEFYLNQYNYINLLINDYNQAKIINLDPSRNVYYNKMYNTTIIELKEYDNINNYLELDDNLFSNNIKSLFESESIYILQYLNGGKAIVSYGLLNELNGFNMNNICYINNGSNGAPILNLTNNKVLGISLETKENLNFNKGIFLKFPIEEFINRYQIKMNQMPNMFNNNFPGMGMNNMMPNMMMNNNNMMPNMMINNNMMPNMMMMNNNNMMPNMMMMNNNNQELKKEEWLKVLELGVDVIDNLNIPEQKKNITFVTVWGIRYNLVFNYGTTIDQMIKQFFQRIERIDLYYNKTKDIIFIHNGIILRFGDNTPIEKFFEGIIAPKILVNDVNNIIGGSSS